MQEPPRKRPHLDTACVGQADHRLGADNGASEAQDGAGLVCPNGCVGGTCCLQQWLEVPRLHVRELTRSRYLAQAVKGVPFVLLSGDSDDLEAQALLENDSDATCARGCADAWGWPVADDRWSNLKYFCEHADVRKRSTDEDAVIASYCKWHRCSFMTVSAQKAFNLLNDREAARSKREHTNRVSKGSFGGSFTDALPCSEQLYLTGWEYDPPYIEEPVQLHNRLSDDVCSGKIPVMPCLLAASQRPIAQAASKVLRWLFIGEQGTSCDAHSDPFASHAWMWLACGAKEWRIVEAPSAHPSAVKAAISDIADINNEGSLNLFDCHSAACAVGQRRIWHTSLRRGEFLFVPSRCVHAVRNVASFTVAVSHNFVDAACLPAVLHALQGAMLLLASTEKGGATREEAQTILHEQLSAPMYALLSIALLAPQALEEMVKTALLELKTIVSGTLEKSKLKPVHADCKDLFVEEVAAHMDTISCLWQGTLSILQSLIPERASENRDMKMDPATLLPEVLGDESIF